MKTRKILSGLLLTAIVSLFIPRSGIATAQTLPSTPPTEATVLSNAVAATGGGAVATFALNLLPGWDRTATNSFGAHELEFEVAPTWKSTTASGSTPFVSLGGNYFFTRNWGAGGDLVTFGDGAGKSDLDSAHGFFIGRKDLGNVAGYALLGGGRDLNLNAYDAEAGIGLQYRYSTGIGLFVDTRYLHLFDSGTDHEFLTRFGLTLHF